MKGTLKKVALLGVTALGALSFVSCGETDETEKPDVPPTPPVEEKVLTDFQKAAKLGLQDAFDAIGSLDQFTSTVKTAVQSAYNAGVKAIEDAETDAAAYTALKTAKKNLADAIPGAEGLISYLDASVDDKTEILGLLEAYTIRNGITGLTLFENGGYVAYNERVQLGSENYIPGYGFGTLAEGSLKSDLATEPNADWKRYWHSYTAENPNDANYLDSDNNTVSTVYGYFSASYFTTFMNDTKDGYDWVPELATAKPEPVGVPAGATTSKKWRIPVRTGSDLKYNTLSTLDSRKVFNGREVALEDYEYTFKLLLTAQNEYFRGSELASKTTGAIVGTMDYYNASKNGFNADAWDKVGLKFYEEGGKSWIEYEFVNATDEFYAMYYFNSSLYQPIPEDFITAIGGAKNYCRFSEDDNSTILDNALSLGAYTVEAWNDLEIVYKKNPYYVFSDTKYSVAGVHIDILPAAKTDNDAGMKEFIAGNLDSCGISQNYLDEWRDNPLTKMTVGDTNFKMNVNALTQEGWDVFFGPEGKISPLSQGADAWECEPALSNTNFVRALNYSINRLEFGSSIGNTPGVSYLSSEYLSDPVNGIAYNSTKAHEDAISFLTDGTDGYGYNLDLARNYFKIALQELVLDGKYQEGTTDKPTVISLEMAFPYQSYIDLLGKPLEQYFTTAFNDVSVTGGKWKLECTYWVADGDPNNVFYEKSMVGQYDLSFGAISGNPFNPLDFMSVLSTDPVLNGNFCLNWAFDTNSYDGDYIVYKGMRWTYDALWLAANTLVFAEDGVSVPMITPSIKSTTMNNDGTATVVIDVVTKTGLNYHTDVADLVIFAQKVEGIRDSYIEESVFEDADNFTVVESDPVTANGNTTVTFTITVSADKVNEYIGELGFDVYYASYVDDEVAGADLISVYTKFAK